MRRKLGIAILFCLLFTLFAVSSAWAADPSGSAVISNIKTSTITVGAAQAQWNATGRMGAHEGTVYKEFALSAGSLAQPVSLASGNVSTITVLEPGSSTPKSLAPNADETLWFNVAKPAGGYVFTITLTNGTVYEATLAWPGPMQLLDITWDLPATSAATVDQSFAINTGAAITTDAATAGVSEIGRVLYIIDIRKNDNTAATPDDVGAVAGDGQALGYDTSGGFFYWGPQTGFTFSTPVSTTFTVTFKKPNTYTVRAYAVQLPSPPSP